MSNIDIKQEVEFGFCPYCNEKYELKWYKSHKKCSECGMPFNLKEEQEKKEDEVAKYNKQVKKTNAAQAETENNTVKSRYKKINISNNENSSRGTTLDNNNEYNCQEKDVDWQDEMEKKVTKKSLFEDDYEDVEIYDEYESISKEQFEEKESIQISEIIEEKNDKKPILKSFFKNEKNNLLKKTKNSEELEVEETVFNSNKDGFYDDAVPVVNPQEDHIKKSTIIKMIGMIVSLLFITIFMIYYA